MRKLRVRLYQLESRHHGSCQFCEAQIDTERGRIIPTSRYIYKMVIERDGMVGGTALRFCPQHLREFYGQFKSGLLRLRRKKVTDGDLQLQG